VGLLKTRLQIGRRKTKAGGLGDIMAERNGQTKWLLGALATAILGAAGWAASDVRTNAAAVPVLSKDVAVLQQKSVEQDKTNTRVEKQLDRVERKIDLLVRDRGIRPPEGQ
jgi:hypothetical protein